MSLEDTQRRRHAVETIHDIVSAMRAIAAGRIQGAQRALASARRYEQIVLRAIAALPLESLTLPPVPSGQPAMLLVMMSEQPFCGAFNQDLAVVAERRIRELQTASDVQLVVVGQRGERLLAARGLTIQTSLPGATSLHGLRDAVKHVAEVVSERYASGAFHTLHVLYNRHQSVTEQVVTEEMLLPPDLTKLRESVPVPPRPYFRYLPEATLLAKLIAEYVFINLHRIAADTFASEQASRLVAMDGATRNTERLTHSLVDLEQRERQDEITRQVLELISARVLLE